jgi:uncharacterized membrane protein YheB (UPF0754 family)
MNNKNRKIPNITNLHAEKMVKEKAKNEIFTIVLNKCIDQILETNSRTEHTFIYFEVPNIIIGFPGYNRLACIHFLINELSKENYKVEFIEPFYLYIDWNKSKSKTIDNLMIQNIIPTSNPDKLREQTKEILKKYPNASKIVFEYEDSRKDSAYSKNKKK